MPFQMRDETAGIDLLWIDNAGQLGLGSIPNGGQALTVLGASVLSSDARFPDGSLRPGVPAAYYGSVSIPASSTANVAISVAQPPSVTGTILPDQVTTSNIRFPNTSDSASLTVDYSIW